MAAVTKDRAPVTAPTASSYRRLLVEARKKQLADTRENVNRLLATYEKAAQQISSQLLNLPGFMLDEREVLQQIYLRQVLSNIDGIITQMTSDYSQMLDASMLDLAQAAAAREDAAQQLMASSAARDYRLAAAMQRTYVLTDGTRIGVQFGRVAQGAVERVAGRYYADGLTLSERIHGQLTETARKAVQDTIVQAVQEGIPARQLASRLETALNAPKVGNARYNAMRIARTEINAAHREAHIQSVIDPATGGLKPFIQAVGFRLSLSHKEADICDIWAAHDSGLGPGNYLPADAPVEHPHGLCHTVSVLTNYPDVSIPAKAPDVGAVPASQVAYYAGQGDGPAQAIQGGA